MATSTTTTPAPGNHTKVLLIRGQDSISASGAATGGFVNVASLMHEVVQKMVDNGFKVVFASVDNKDLGTTSWGTLTSAAGVLTWAAPTLPPKVGAPTTGTAVKISGGPTASITLEAGPKVDALNPASAVAIAGVSPASYYPKEPWRVKFELLSTECVAAYVATPLQLPGYYGSGSTLVGEAWGLPGSNSRLVDANGVPLDAAGAIGAQQIISTYQQVTEVAVDTGNTGTGYAVGDYLYEDAYTGKATAPSATGNSGLYVTVGTGTAAIPLPIRYPAIFRVDSITPPTGTTTTTTAPGVIKGEIKSLSIVVPGKYEPTVFVDGTTTLKNYTGTGTGGTVKATLKLATKCSAVDELDPYQGFYNRGGRVGANGASYPLTYELAVSNSGFFLGIYESSWATQVGGTTTGTGTTTVPGRFNWMVCQRPVDRNTGVILDKVDSLTSKHPVFCVNGVAGRYYTFVVREKDIAHPTAGPEDHTKIAYYNNSGGTSGTLVSGYVGTMGYNNYVYRVPAVLNSEDNHLLFNPENQISLTEDKKYLVSFPHNLATPRFRYTEELDLIGLTSSDVLMSGQVITINTYSESQDREYLALPPSGKYNTGLRICVAKTTAFGTP